MEEMLYLKYNYHMLKYWGWLQNHILRLFPSHYFFSLSTLQILIEKKVDSDRKLFKIII